MDGQMVGGSDATAASARRRQETRFNKIQQRIALAHRLIYFAENQTVNVKDVSIEQSVALFNAYEIACGPSPARKENAGLTTSDGFAHV